MKELESALKILLLEALDDICGDAFELKNQ